jgi:hypothetical protein
MNIYRGTSPAVPDKGEDDHLPEIRNRFGLKAIQCVLVLLLLFQLSRHAHWTVVLTASLIFISIGFLIRCTWRLAKEVWYLRQVDNQNHKGVK